MNENIINLDYTNDVNEETPDIKRETSFFDTLTLQAAICLIIAIGYAAVNMLAPEISVQMFDTYAEQSDIGTGDRDVRDVINELVEFINSTPRTYD
jgi:hypothetical protein